MRATAPPRHTRRAASALTSGHLFDALAGAAARLSGSLDRAAIFRLVVAEVGAALEVDAVTIRAVDERGRIPVRASSGLSRGDARRLPDFSVDDAWFRRLRRTRRPWLQRFSTPDAAYPADLQFGVSACIPLVEAGEVIGLVAAVRRQPRPFASDEIAFLAAVALQATIALHNAELYAEAQRWVAQLGVVQASVNRMNRLTSVAEIGQAVVEETRRLVEYHNCRVYVLEPPLVVPIAFKGEVGTYQELPLELLRTPIGVGVTGWVAEHGEPLLIHDANADPRGATIPGTERIDESMVVVPMKYDDATIGVVALSKLGLHQFDERDLQLMQILANAAATAIQGARALEESRRAAERMRSLLRMSAELAQSLDPATVADVLARHLTEATGVDECGIGHWDRERDAIVIWGSWPAGAALQDGAVYPLVDFPLTRRVVDEQLVALTRVDDPAADPAERAHLQRLGCRGSAMVALVAKGQVIGLVELATHGELRLDPAQLDLAQAMANEAAMALENARLYDAARDLADRDPLTGFLNHRAFHERLGAEILRAHRSRAPLSVLMIDLDTFKLVNDTLGHQVGDQVLRWTAERIAGALRASDVAARYGGDEFAVILPDADARFACAVAQRIVAAFAAEAFPLAQGGGVPIAVSIGSAGYPADAHAPGELIGLADGALYRAKWAGGGMIASADDETPAPAPVMRLGEPPPLRRASKVGR